CTPVRVLILFRLRQSRRVYCTSSYTVNASAALMRSKYPFHGMYEDCTIAAVRGRSATDGIADSRAPIAVAVVEHHQASRVLEHERIRHHLRRPARSRHLENDRPPSRLNANPMPR